MRKAPTAITYKLLYARSGNECAFPRCNHPVYNYDGSLSNLGITDATYNTPYGSQPAYLHSITHKNAFGQVIAAGHGSSFYSGPIISGTPIGTTIWSTFGYNQFGLLTSELTNFPMTL